METLQLTALDAIALHDGLTPQTGTLDFVANRFPRHGIEGQLVLL
jgi:hypothetical protein